MKDVFFEKCFIHICGAHKNKQLFDLLSVVSVLFITFFGIYNKNRQTLHNLQMLEAESII